ncbi:cupin domain-containing protein [Jannaschia seohaensis]|uniref:Cupin domain-containing protein n=1 Tax=Jannaschia seohaensis TaxID=475081 RepID=A0A2Y9AVU1_9RHOB|nr:hypothetical protein [Jannaschia seohaensis]PWJ16940.1 hypothetical protein BCF38_10753 [Jannaschia seohaensis]SSA48156.1 hypothetical protein SAMN05421539_10753 [Jannaschia seohaensis]
MTSEEFKAICRGKGYALPKQVSFEALSRSVSHTHDQVSFVYVLEGEFILNTPAGRTCYGAGETCLLDADVEHAEEAGPSGAVILVARK